MVADAQLGAESYSFTELDPDSNLFTCKRQESTLQP